jgi:hypothetical protein
MAKKKQQMRYNDGELSIIKKTFVENDELLLAMRKVMLQFELNDADKAILKVFKAKEIQKLISKVFLPVLEAEAPRNQLIDLWMTFDVADKSMEEKEMIFESRLLLIQLLEQQLKEIFNIAEGQDDSREIKLTELVGYKGQGAKAFYPGLHARNTLITHVETQLSVLEGLAGMKDETVEQTMARLQKDSAK